MLMCTKNHTNWFSRFEDTGCHMYWLHFFGPHCTVATCICVGQVQQHLIKLKARLQSTAMDVLTGILVDVSGSMAHNIGDKTVDGSASSWAKSVFEFIDRLIKYDTTSDHRGFAIAFGSNCYHVVFDVLTTLKRLEEDKTLDTYLKALQNGRHCKRDMIEEMIRILETNGAPRISHLASIDEMNEQIDEFQTAILLSLLKNNSKFRRDYVNQILPRWCRPDFSKTREILWAMDIMYKNGAPRVYQWTSVYEIDQQMDEKTTAALFDALQNHLEFRDEFICHCLPDECKQLQFSSLASEFANYTVGWVPSVRQRMTENSIKDVIVKGKDLAEAKGIYTSVKDLVKRGIELVENYIVTKVTDNSVYSAKVASEILHGCIGDHEQELTDDRRKELLERVKPFIYGPFTPLMECMRQAVTLFRYRPNRDSRHKLLFILSDGMATDGDKPPLYELADLRVQVVCCYITRKHIKEPRRLYSNMQPEWEKEAKFMFDMSSTIPTQKIPRTLFVKKGWKIDIDRNETHMFFQINNPGIINEVCAIARDCVCSQDSLADVLSSISLDLYINKANEGLSPDQQKEKEKTCYAIASATVIHMALMRIVGRFGGYPGFYQIRDELITKHGVHEAVVGKVLREVCPKYRLRCSEKPINECDALTAVVEKRPVVAIYQLSDAEWRSFHKFYQRNPQGILTKVHLNIEERSKGTALRGHAVVLTSFDGKCLRLMNSKGSEFADGGFFKVENAATLGMKFYDIFWTKADLLTSEKEAYRKDGPIISAMLMDKLTSLQTATHKCPKCSVESNVSEFRGHLLATVCPRCGDTFNANEDGSGALALNIYLTSLLSSDA